MYPVELHGATAMSKNRRSEDPKETGGMATKYLESCP